MRAYKPVNTIPRPSCERCETDMWLTSIEPDEPGCDRRAFECPRCQHLTIKIVKYREETASTGYRCDVRRAGFILADVRMIGSPSISFRQHKTARAIF